MHSDSTSSPFDTVEPRPIAAPDAHDGQDDGVVRAAGVIRVVRTFLARLAQPWLRRAVLVVAVLLAAPTLFGGFSLDDYVILYQMDGPPDREWSGSAPFDLFQWMTPAQNRRLIDGNGMPWWTNENAKLSFLRPVSSWTHFIDNEMFGHNAVWSHFHSLLWFALLIGLAMKAYDELIENRWVVGVASAMFALDSAHGSAVGWISNRNAAIAAAFGLAALLCHHRWRQGAGSLTAIIGWSCFALSLLSGESAVGIFGYLIAYALTYEQRPIVARLRSVAPYLLITAVWAVTRSALGYGSYGLGAYVDPIHEPLEFLRVLPERFAILLSSQLSRVGADLYDMLPPSARPFQLAWGFAMCAVFAWFVWPTLRRERSLRFWALGSMLSIPPLTATVPNDRLLTLVGLGMMPTLAFAIYDALQVHDAAQAAPKPSRPRRVDVAKLRTLCATALLIVHLAIDPLLLPISSMTPSLVARWAATADAALPSTPDMREKTLIVAAVPDSVLLSYLPVMRSLEGRTRPNKLYWLAATPSAATFERRASNVLRVSSPTGLFDPRSEARSPGLALRKGERVQLSQMTVEVIELTADGRPSVCDFVFSEPLESSRFVWRVWDSGQVRDFQPPVLGQSVHVSTG